MSIVDEIQNYGCHDVVSLNGEPSQRAIDYLDLLKASKNGAVRIDAVAEFQSRPLLYIVRQDRLSGMDKSSFIDLQCLLASRGERAFLGVLRPGELIVYPINLLRSDLKSAVPKTISGNTPESSLFFQTIVNGQFELEGQPEAADYVFQAIHGLMTEASHDLINEYGLDPLDVLSFLGRALFFRFLTDREIIRPDELSSICPNAHDFKDCFSNVENSIAACQWLDETFNGDLLPLSRSYEEVFRQADLQTEGKLFIHLEAILEGWKPSGQGAYQVQWSDLNFSHVPIGVLSQVYESFSRIWDPLQSAQTSVHYTPKNIAKFLVDDAFEGVPDKMNAKILDPSCGAGIFLVLAFRKLVAARWEQNKKRPFTKAI